MQPKRPSPRKSDYRGGRRKGLCTGALLVVFLLSGCGLLNVKTDPAVQPAKAAAPNDKVIVYIYRLFNYSGGGRIHQLHLDRNAVGHLTRANYYRLELWPGHYYVNIFLPAEKLLGHVSPAMSSGQALFFNPWDAGKVYLLVYEDGHGLTLAEATPRSMTKLETERTLAKSLSARDTARVKFFMSTRYDGPEMYGKPHGRGALSWEDGSRYVGVFDHGQLTPEGRFYFPNGEIYMGELFWGRPKGWGILMAPDERILYAGAFVDERPHGEGLRMGKDGPEYCRYEHGVDITRSIFQLVDEIVAKEEAEKLARFLSRSRAEAAAMEGEAPEAEAAVRKINDADYHRLIEAMEASREMRLSKTLRRLSEENRTRIDHERAWCRKELEQGKDWCICAPFELYTPPLDSCMR